jgi:hypothetical protein
VAAVVKRLATRVLELLVLVVKAHALVEVAGLAAQPVLYLK